jgi:hypothetical protein
MTHVSFPKHQYVRSPALMTAYRLIACQHCGREDGTVCGAHSNWHPHNKGGAIKADDNRCASLCHSCHSTIDQGSTLSETQRKSVWWHAHQLTVITLVARNLWPPRVPIPDVSTCPWDDITKVYRAKLGTGYTDFLRIKGE